ncbi:MAG: glycosyltransferase [Chloroflexi bacterium]|nr:MAG: glycosyltransferase [Chloroflexota bacterium]
MKKLNAETQRRKGAERARGAEEESVEFSSVEILGVGIHCVDFTQTLVQIARWIEERRTRTTTQYPISNTQYLSTRQLCTVNPEFVMEARRDPAFAAVLNRADLCAPDGVGILWAGRLLGQPFAERVTGSDGIYRISERAAAQGWRVYFLGAGPGVAEQTAERLCSLYPGLQVAGTFSGSPSDEGWPEIQQRLAAARPDLLFVAFGHPRQDFWIDAHRHELPVAVALGVGGAFDFVAGVARRAPLWMQRLGLEWLHRLVVEPWRWRRMRVLPIFAGLVLGQWVKQHTRTSQ